MSIVARIMARDGDCIKGADFRRRQRGRVLAVGGINLEAYLE